MAGITLTTLCITLCFANAFASLSIAKRFIAPTSPPLQRVRTIGEARGALQHAVLDFIGLVARHGYPAEEHRVTTEDGYNLVFHRIPGSPRANNTKEKRVVYIQHGVIASSDTWVLMGPGKDLPYLLADAGYDVWLGNLRGNTYCRSHVNLTTADKKFWNYSFHEHGVHDLRSMVDYILERTGQKSIYYIGHSMGTAVSYVLLSMRPEYNQKFKFVVSLSPVAFLHYGVSPVLKTTLDNVKNIRMFLDSNQIYEIAPQSVTYASLAKTFCRDSSIFQSACLALIFSFAGADPKQLNATLLPYIFSYYPCGSSTQTFYHFHQNYVAADFRAYDYGSVENYKRYNQNIPPQYNFSKISAPVSLFYGNNDALLLPVNAKEVAKRLPNLVTLEEVPYKLFSHVDFLWGMNAKDVLYDRVIQLMQDY